MLCRQFGSDIPRNPVQLQSWCPDVTDARLRVSGKLLIAGPEPDF